MFIKILHRHLLQGKPAPFEIAPLNDFCLPRSCSWGHFILIQIMRNYFTLRKLKLKRNLMLVTLDVCGKSRVVVAFALISILLNEVTEIAVLRQIYQCFGNSRMSGHFAFNKHLMSTCYL